MTRRGLAAAATIGTLLLGLSACSGDPQILMAHRWVLDPSSIARMGIEVPAGTIVDLRFEDGRMQGTAGCVEYDAPYEAGNGSLSVERVSVTRRPCDDPTMDVLGTAYVEALAAVHGWRVTENTDGPPSLGLAGEDGAGLDYTAVDQGA